MKEVRQELDKDEEKKQLTDWKNPPKLSALQENLRNASQYHSRQVQQINEWLDNLHIEGNAKIKATKGRSSVQPKIIRRQAEWRYAALSEPFLSASDLFDVNPVSWEDREAARQNALILNNQFQTKIDKVKFIDEFIRAAVCEGTAILRVGWEFKEKEVEVEKPVFEYQPIPPEAIEQIQAQVEELMRMRTEEPDSFTQVQPELIEMLRMLEEEQQMVIPYVVGSKTVQETKTVVNRPTIEVCDYRSIIIDPTCEGDITKANFIIHTFSSSLSELKESNLYENLEEIEKNNNFDGYLSVDDNLFSKGTNDTFFADNPRKKLTVYEYWGYWDIDDTGIVKPILVTWVGNTIIRMTENPFPDGELPFVIVPYLPVKNSLYGEPDGELLTDHQRIVGAITRGIIDLLGKSANSQTGLPKGLLDSVNLKKFLNGQDYMYNPVNMNPQSAIFQHQYPEIPQSALTMIQMMNMEAEALTGVKSFSTGGGITGAGLGDVAAGVRGALDAASKREMGILRRLSNGIIQVGRKIISMNSEFLEEEEVVRITNNTFIPVRRDDLAGNFDLKLTISTAESDNNKAQELSFMLQTMGNNMDPSMSKLILSEIARLRQMPDLAKQIEDFEPQPSPTEQEIQQLQIEKLKAEVELLKAQAKEAATKGDVNTAKVEVEQARAEVFQNDADNKTLDFVEKQQGLDVEKEIQKDLALQNNQADHDLVKQMLSDAAKLAAEPGVDTPDIYPRNDLTQRGIY